MYLVKLKGYGVNGKVLSWVKAFLTDRRQKVLVNQSQSDWATVTSGIPQGSVIGPQLFIIFVKNDPSDCVKSAITFFADYTKIYREIKDQSDIKQLQDNIDSLKKWSRDWQLLFNASKCKCMHLGKKNDKHIYIISEEGQIELEETTEEKDLGIWVDNELGFKDHINKVVNKANSTFGIIRRSYTYLGRQNLALLYEALVRPLLEYRNLVWSPYLKGDIEKLEAVQHRATRIIPALKELPYQERMKLLKLPSLRYRRAKRVMIETYKYLNGINKVSSHFHPLSKDRRTRGHSLKLKKSEKQHK